MTGRRVLGANVSGYAAVWAFKLLSDHADRSIRHHLAMGRPEIARELGEVMADLREAGRQHLAAATSGSGTAEPSWEAVPPGSEAPPSGGSHCEVDVRAAALVLGVSTRYVRRLLADGELAGAKDRAGHWSIEPGDLDRLVADRSVTR